MNPTTYHIGRKLTKLLSFIEANKSKPIELRHVMHEGGFLNPEPCVIAINKLISNGLIKAKLYKSSYIVD